MDETIEYYVTNNFGKAVAYPATHAKAIEQLTGCKTIRKADYEALTAMGFKLKRVFAPIKKA